MQASGGIFSVIPWPGVVSSLKMDGGGSSWQHDLKLVFKIHTLKSSSLFLRLISLVFNFDPFCFAAYSTKSMFGEHTTVWLHTLIFFR